MAFRIKQTHPSLDQNPIPKTQEKPPMSFFDDNVLTAPPKSAPSVPRQSSNKGIAIRQVPGAQADHM
jgi:hypothetical protein